MLLGADRIELSPEDLGGRIAHHGRTLEAPDGASLSWPIYPHNPYSDTPETAIVHAVGRLTVPLALKARRGKYVRAKELELNFRLAVP